MVFLWSIRRWGIRTGYWYGFSQKYRFNLWGVERVGGGRAAALPWKIHLSLYIYIYIQYILIYSCLGFRVIPAIILTDLQQLLDINHWIRNISTRSNRLPTSQGRKINLFNGSDSRFPDFSNFPYWICDEERLPMDATSWWSTVGWVPCYLEGYCLQAWSEGWRFRIAVR